MGVGFLLESEARPAGREVDYDTHQSALDEALEEMLFSGGSLNLNLLGGSNIGFRVQDAS
jgi:hypothetical protein